MKSAFGIGKMTNKFAHSRFVTSLQYTKSESKACKMEACFYLLRCKLNGLILILSHRTCGLRCGFHCECSYVVFLLENAERKYMRKKRSTGKHISVYHSPHTETLLTNLLYISPFIYLIVFELL